MKGAVLLGFYGGWGGEGGTNKYNPRVFEEHLVVVRTFVTAQRKSVVLSPSEGGNLRERRSALLSRTRTFQQNVLGRDGGKRKLAYSRGILQSNPLWYELSAVGAPPPKQLWRR